MSIKSKFNDIIAMGIGDMPDMATEPKLDKEQVVNEGEQKDIANEMATFEKSSAWKAIKSAFLERIEDIRSLESINLNDSDEKVGSKVKVDLLVANELENFIHTIEGIIEEGKGNAE